MVDKRERKPLDHASIEPKWQQYWLEHKSFAAPVAPKHPKSYVLDMFPYPSGAGLHVGHPEGYTASDIFVRWQRMKGIAVLHPMGWDAFGLPAEQYAIQTGQHPAITTTQNIATFKRQIQALGFSYDWDREISTTDPEYVRWTQWLFLQIWKQGLVYEAEVPVNWCPGLGTVLANEEVVDGKSERGGHPVIRKPMRQWMMKITAFADRLLNDLDGLDWTESIKAQQRNWIGKSEGAEIEFALQGGGGSIRVFTTRPDTLCGATYMVLAPEHALVKSITTDAQRAAVAAYVEQSSKKSDLDRTDLAKDKSGVFTGAFAVNPATKQTVPVWIGDYILGSYGTGAIMAVPGHDERDHAFATKYGLPIVQVVRSAQADQPDVQLPFTEPGISVHSGEFSGLKTSDCKQRVTQWLETNGIGKGTTNYKLRDWLFSRQRYWGEPFPLVRCAKCGVQPVPEDQLPVLLPQVSDFRPTDQGDPPLARAPEWVATKCSKCGGPATRDTNTMPNWAGSCWYYLRFVDPKNTQRPFDSALANAWLPVDLYIGGAEHAVVHLLYARFWHKVFFDLGLIATQEPFHKLVNQGLILGEDGEKMSKSRGNVVNPDDVVREFGADSLRLYEMFMGPLEATKPWNTRGIVGVRRFLERAWDLFQRDITNDPAPEAELRLVHKTIQGVGKGIETLSQFNTSIAKMMELVNDLTARETQHRGTLETFAKLLSPFAPHLAEEAWELLGNAPCVAQQKWPEFDPALVKDSEVEIAVQVLGKVRARIVLPADADEKAHEKAALSHDDVKKFLEGKTIRKVIVVKGRNVNIVVG